MKLDKFRLLIVVAFLGIFFIKMVISVAPVFVANLDKEVINNVIMQVELEHGADHDSGKTLKYTDIKTTDHFNHTYAYLPLRYHFHVDNDYIAHIKRYVDPYHPSVPTPPPNYS